MTAETLYKTRDLSNGLTLNIMNASRKISKDAWLIKLFFRISVTVEQNLFKEDDLKRVSFQDIRDTLGSEITFEALTERNFIQNDQKEALLEKSIQDYLASAESYLSHPDFAKKLIIRKYIEASKTGRVSK